MSTFITGSTGYLGSYVINEYRVNSKEHLLLLIRAKTQDEAQKKLWQACQLHMNFEDFSNLLERVQIYLGDLSSTQFGLQQVDYTRLIDQTDSILHIAASLNRKSEKACLNVNLRGSLHVIEFGRIADQVNRLKKISVVSTVAVAGQRQDEVVLENEMIDFDRSDYDPYARTKKFMEYMLDRLMPNVPKCVFRPSIVLGDSRFGETTQFDMVQAFVWLSKLLILPFNKNWRADIVNADFVSNAIFQLHQKTDHQFLSYNLSSGVESCTYDEITRALSSHGDEAQSMFVPALEKPCTFFVNAMAQLPRSLKLSRSFALLKVFWPYLTFNTVFDNSRVVEELSIKPVKFTAYAHQLKQFAVKNNFKYKHKPWPDHALIKNAA